ncbi:hypothetical protein GCM10009713_33110 [Brevibacterium celere]
MRAMRVLSIPDRHPYVAAITEDTAVTLVPAPLPDGTAAPAGHAQFDMDNWASGQFDTFDIVHVHFGFELAPHAVLRRFVDDLRYREVPLLVTVHDLDNPQLPLADQTGFHQRLELLVRSAARIITLTPGAQAEIADRWQLDAEVIAHPPLGSGLPAGGDGVGAVQTDRQLSASARFAVGVLVKDARPSVDLDAIAALARALHDDDALREASSLTVLKRPVVRHGREADVARLEAVLAATGMPAPVIAERMSDSELEQWLADLDCLVLPYSHGTHSGLLELANDVGTRVLHSPIGHLSEQRPGQNLSVDFHDRSALTRALRRAAARPPLRPVAAAEHRAALARVRSAHTEIYRALAAASTVRSAGA